MHESEQLSPFLTADMSAAAATHTSRRTLRLVRWWAAAVVALTALSLLLSVWYLIRTGDATSFLSHQLLTPFLSLIYARLGVVIATKRPRNPIGWIFLGVCTSYVLSSLAAGTLLYTPFLPAYISPALLDLARWLGNWVWLPAQLLPLSFVFLLFPDGHLPTRRWRVVGWAAGLGLLFLMLGLAAHPGPMESWGTQANPFGIAGTEDVFNTVVNLGSVLLAIGVFGSMAAVVVRFRRSRGIERAQLKWLLYAAVIVLVIGIFTTWLWPSGYLSSAPAMEVSILLTEVMTLGVAGAASMAIMRYRLYDIDIIINRTLVYGVMTGIVFVIYGVVVGGVGVILRAETIWPVALLATGLVAVLFEPIRSRLQRSVNRLLYGQRDEPFEVLAQLGLRLEQNLAPETLYATIAQTVAKALQLPYVGIQVCEGGHYNTIESYGRPVGEPLALPLTYQSEDVGRLLVSRRAPEGGFADADERLLRNIARQVGMTVYDVGLKADLQHSRQQLVTSREEERRRLRRDLHDGLGPALASLLLEARVLRRMIREDPAAAESLADEMQSDIRTTIDDIRRVVHELRPPALDDLGLVPALNVLAAKIGRPEGSEPTSLQVSVDAPDDLPPLPAAVEVAAYRIVQEALTNIAHHARARCAVVSLRLDHRLHVAVTDDGVGFHGGRVGGLGLHSMRERAAELGGSFNIEQLPSGGTIVRAELPVNGA